MNFLKFLLKLIALLSLSIHQAMAEQAKFFDNYTVYYVAVNSSFLSAEIARQYNIVRGNNRAFLNIAVHKNNPDKSTRAIEAKVTGTVTNLMQQSQAAGFKQVREAEAIYYIGSFRFSNQEVMHFTIDIQPDLTGPTYTLKFTQKFYTD